MAEIDFKTKDVHRVLYDAEITADLVWSVLTGEYRLQRDEIYERLYGDNQKSFGNSIGLCCRNFFSNLAW